MRTGRPIAPLSLANEERESLENWARPRVRKHWNSGRALCWSARLAIPIWWLRANSSNPTDRRQMVAALSGPRSRWFARRAATGAPRQVGDAQIERVVRLTLESAAADATHWSTRAMAKRSGLSQSTIGRVWRVFGLQLVFQRRSDDV